MFPERFLSKEPCININQRTQSWATRHKKLNRIESTVGPLLALHINKTLWRDNRQDNNRTYTWLTRGLLMRRDAPDQCRTCGAAVSVKHILIYCRLLDVSEILYEVLKLDRKDI